MLSYAYFKMDPSCDKFRNEVLDGTKQMLQAENIETSALKAEYAIKFMNQGSSCIDPRYLCLYNYFIDIFGTGENAKLEQSVNPDTLFELSARSFNSLCKKYEEQYGRDWLLDRDIFVSCTDKVFVRLVRLYNLAAKHNAALAGQTPKAIAEHLLARMGDYYSCCYLDDGLTIDEYVLDCLMYTDTEF